MGKVTDLKKHIGKYIIVEWYDPLTEIRVALGEFRRKGMAYSVTNGKLIEVSKGHIILEHDKCGELGDYTMIHIALINKVKLANSKGGK